MQNTQKNDPVSALFERKADEGRKRLPVAVMDSGAGGLSVLRQIRRMLPREELLYFGDSANAPYGERKIFTRPLVFEGNKMELNFATSARGYVFIKIHANDTTLCSVELFGNSLDRIVPFDGDLED